jgi:hypothetical protein
MKKNNLFVFAVADATANGNHIGNYKSTTAATNAAASAEVQMANLPV